MGAMANVRKILVGKPEGNSRSLGRPRHESFDNIERGVKEM
jgi:hypothetical protein